MPNLEQAEWEIDRDEKIDQQLTEVKTTVEAAKQTFRNALETTKEIRGVISRVFFAGKTFSAGRLRKNDGTEVSIAGKIYFELGDLIAAAGSWVNDAKYGWQFRVDEAICEQEIDPAGLANWLANHPAAVGIGSVKAKRLADLFGKNFEKVLINEPEKIAAAVRVPIDKIKILAAAWEEKRNENAIATRLSAWELTPHQCKVVINQFGNDVVRMLEKNPYLLMDQVDGFGFKRVDEIALRTGISKENPHRLRAAVLSVMSDVLGEGSTCETIETLESCATDLLILDRLGADKLVHEQVVSMIGSDLIETSVEGLTTDSDNPWVTGECKYVAASWIYAVENSVARFLKTGMNENRHFQDGEIDGLVEKFCGQLDESQKQAVLQALCSRIALISGGAGAGKTFVLRTVVKIYHAKRKLVALCSPTGKAARRMEEVTQHDAYTIHRLLGYNPKFGFLYCHDNPLPYDVVIVDECSMTDLSLARHLFDAIGPRTCLVLVGDHNQLPPVGYGALLRDCIQHQLVPLQLLQFCHRQAGPLKHNCSAILEGRVEPSITNTAAGKASPWYVHRQLNTPEAILASLEQLYSKFLREWGYDPITDVQIMTPIHKGPLGTRAINILLQRLHQQWLGNTIVLPDPEKRPPLYYGDKVIQTRNNYELDIMNGHMGVVVDVKPLVINFDGNQIEIPKENERDIELGYCLTPHKCQGSEYPCSITIVHSSHSFMHSRNWLYTACTRAQKTCIIMGDRYAIEQAARKVVSDNRKTLLPILVRRAPVEPEPVYEEELDEDAECEDTDEPQDNDELVKGGDYLSDLDDDTSFDEPPPKPDDEIPF